MIYEVGLRGFAEYLEGMKMFINCTGKEYVGSKDSKKLVAEGDFGIIYPDMKKMYLSPDSLHIEVYFMKTRFVLKKAEDDTVPNNDIELLLGDVADIAYSAYDIPEYVFNYRVDVSMICKYEDFRRVYDNIMNELASSYSKFCSDRCSEASEKMRKGEPGINTGSENEFRKFVSVLCSN